MDCGLLCKTRFTKDPDLRCYLGKTPCEHYYYYFIAFISHLSPIPRGDSRQLTVKKKIH